MDKKVYLFDLDDTIYLYQCKDKEYVKEYHKKISNFLYNLKKDNKIIGLFTNNLEPNIVLKDLDINPDIFDIISSPIKMNDDQYQEFLKNTKYNSFSWTYWNNYWYIRHPKNKLIEKYIKENNFDLNEIIYFDDQKKIIESIKSIGINTVLVDPLVGIKI